VVAIFWLSVAGLLYFAIREAGLAPDYSILSLKTDHGAVVIAESPANLWSVSSAGLMTGSRVEA